MDVLTTAGIHLLLGSCGSLATWIEQVTGTILLFSISNICEVAPLKSVNKSGCFPAQTLQTEAPLQIHILLKGTRKRKEL